MLKMDESSAQPGPVRLEGSASDLGRVTAPRHPTVMSENSAMLGEAINSARRACAGVADLLQHH
jgi:hypothetical protein